MLGATHMLHANNPHQDCMQTTHTNVACKQPTPMLHANNLHQHCMRRLPFVYVYISCFWIMWLLVKYYSAYVILRQRFLTSGEASVNEWQEQYMSSSLDKRGKEEGKGVLAALRHFKQLFDPSEV